MRCPYKRGILISGLDMQQYRTIAIICGVQITGIVYTSFSTIIFIGLEPADVRCAQEEFHKFDMESSGEIAKYSTPI